MDAKRWYKRIQAGLILLSVVLLAVGINYTESGATELDYGTMGGFAFEDDFDPDASFIVIVEDTETTCEDFEFELNKQYEGVVPVQKTECERWSGGDVYHYKMNLSYGYYTWVASDYVSVLAVEDDLDVYMENYALGNAIADIGACFCCLGILGYVVIGRGINKALNAEQQVNIMHTQPMIQQTLQPMDIQPVDIIEQPPMDAAAAVEEVEETTGSFWDDLVKG